MLLLLIVPTSLFTTIYFARYRYRRSGSYIGRALRNARRRLFRGRTIRGRKRTLLVITDGVSSDRVRSPASGLKRGGVEMFALGIGSRFRKSQLQLIASSPLNVFTAGFSRLGKVVRAIKDRVCQPTKPTPRRKSHITCIKLYHLLLRR